MLVGLCVAGIYEAVSWNNNCVTKKNKQYEELVNMWPYGHRTFCFRPGNVAMEGRLRCWSGNDVRCVFCPCVDMDIPYLAG